MAERCLILAAVVAAVFLPGAIGGSPSFPDNNPDLGAYQNEGNCFPLEDTWYMIYRNYEYDPYYGGLNCLIVTEIGPYDGTSATLQAQYGGNKTAKVKATPISTPGYTVKNADNFVSLDDPEINYNMTSVYTDCSRCKVLRHSYIDNGKGCSLWQPKKALGEDVSCCKFIYDLICGASPKYQVCDNVE